jgi:hypothetical protein
MKLFRPLLLIAALAFPSLAAAQTSPNLVYGQVPTAAQWNSYFVAKQDTLGYIPVNRAGDSMLGKLITVASGSSAASINVAPGSAPSAPVNGDMWTTTSGVYVRINGATVGPLASAAATTLTVGSTVINSGTDGYNLYNNAGVLGNRQYVPLANGGTNNALTASNGGIVYSDASKLVVLPGTVTAGQCLLSGSSAAPSWGSCIAGTTVSSVAAANATLTVTPTTGSVTAALNLSNANTWAARQTFNASATFPTSGIRLVGSSTGYTDFASANAGASNYVITYPAATGTVALTTGVVSSIAGNVGAFTVSTGITNSTNDIRLDVPVIASRGGTGVVSPTANTIPINQGSSAQTNVALTTGQCLIGVTGSAPVGGSCGGRTLLATLTANNTADNLTDTTSLTSTYKYYDIEILNLIPATSGSIIQLEVETAATFRTSGYLSASSGVASNSGASGNLSTAYIAIQANSTMANATPGLSGYMKVMDPSNASGKAVFMGQTTAYYSAGLLSQLNFSGMYNTAAAVTGFRFRVVSGGGNISSGVVKVYGYN